jgi:hypothetical protein
MNEPKTVSNDWATNSKTNTIRLGLWTVAWVATMAVTAFGPELIWNFATLPTFIAVLGNFGVGFGMILANRRYLLGLDELQQQIFLDAGALTLGVGLVCGFSYELLEDTGLIDFEPQFSHLAILMSVTFLIGMIAGHRRYQ